VNTLPKGHDDDDDDDDDTVNETVIVNRNKYRFKLVFKMLAQTMIFVVIKVK
jgi:hypothetical protein